MRNCKNSENVSLLAEKQNVFWKIVFPGREPESILTNCKQKSKTAKTVSNSERYIFPNKETNSILTIAKTVSNSKTYLSLQTESILSLSSKLWKIYLSWQRNRVYFEKLQSMFQTMKHICIHRSWQRNSKYFEKLQELFQTMNTYISNRKCL